MAKAGLRIDTKSSNFSTFQLDVQKSPKIQRRLRVSRLPKIEHLWGTRLTRVMKENIPGLFQRKFFQSFAVAVKDKIKY